MCIFEQQFTQCNCRIISSDRNSFMYYFSIDHNKRGKVSRKVKQRSYFLLKKLWLLEKENAQVKILKVYQVFHWLKLFLPFLLDKENSLVKILNVYQLLHWLKLLLIPLLALLLLDVIIDTQLRLQGFNIEIPTSNEVVWKSVGRFNKEL